MRGHGKKSQKVDFGYNIPRLAKDLYDFLEALNLRELTVMGHSMGTSVMFSYFDMFGPHRLGKLVIVEQPALLLKNPNWPANSDDSSLTGAIFDFNTLCDLTTALSVPDAGGIQFLKTFFSGLCSKTMSAEEKTLVLECAAQIPPQHAAVLLFNHIANDWRHVPRRILLPTLVIGSRGSAVPWKSLEWIHKQIPDSEFVLFENCGHWLFFEKNGKDKFNQVVEDFVSKKK